jgi:NCS1 family nucleobase:cation symporter-1
VVGAAISFAPLAADYTRHSRTDKATFGSTLVGYGLTQMLCYAIGLLALVTVAHDVTVTGNANLMFNAFIALPVGGICLAILVARELDQSFANVYSTAASTQNLRPLWDRRVLAIAITAVTTVGAIFVNINDYENFLDLLGAVFVPLSAVLIVDFFVVSRGRWDLSNAARSRWAMLPPWALGFVAYQLINPGYVSWWVNAWSHVNSFIGFTPASWMSASILSFAVAAAATLAAGSIVVIVSPHTRVRRQT